MSTPSKVLPQITCVKGVKIAVFNPGVGNIVVMRLSMLCPARPWSGGGGVKAEELIAFDSGTCPNMGENPGN